MVERGDRERRGGRVARRTTGGGEKRAAREQSEGGNGSLIGTEEAVSAAGRVARGRGEETEGTT